MSAMECSSDDEFSCSLPFQTLVLLCGRILFTATRLEDNTKDIDEHEIDRFIPRGGLPCLAYVPNPSFECENDVAGCASCLRKAVQGLAAGNVEGILSASSKAKRIVETLFLNSQSDIPQAMRDCYALSDVLVGIYSEEPDHAAKIALRRRQIRAVDLAQIATGPAYRQALDSAFHDAHGGFCFTPSFSAQGLATAGQDLAGVEIGAPQAMPSQSSTSVKCLPPDSMREGFSIPRINKVDVHEFFQEHMQPQVPVVLRGCMQEWPALTRWCDNEYLQRVAGDRTVPVELGDTYLAQGHSRRLMLMKDFISQYMRAPVRLQRATRSEDGTDVSPPSTPVAYLAQHTLLDQVPALRRDICIPTYCQVSGEIRSINAWFGPGGTVTPLHFDPTHNLLAQGPVDSAWIDTGSIGRGYS
ncbi:hypothetical protein CYMTET_5413 [Cymbomonas tetramitiformis]|uniref:Cupin-like domain-containing protein n=1 Tax=Cymbomonas tetramitiformis TaxID=36881 RepID=A0AAE0GZG0_9CHLO|nr:hypothetical protein CYMTET_5413 [Cymbomonas tetramitiformis]